MIYLLLIAAKLILETELKMGLYVFVCLLRGLQLGLLFFPETAEQGFSDTFKAQLKQNV